MRFEELLRIDEERNKDLGRNKQQVNAAILHRQLLSEGFEIGESTIRGHLRAYRAKHPEVFIRQEYEYGDRCDFDFHQIKLLIDGRLRVFHQTTISCPKSNFIYVELFDNETISAVEQSLINFFRYCHGVFNEVTFDNLRPVVKKYGSKADKELSDEIIKFSTYYNFKVNTCNARKGNEKGHVENAGKNARSDLFSLKYKFDSIEELNQYVEVSLKILNKSCEKEFQKEQESLHPLPIHEYMIGNYGIGKVNTYSFVLVETNYYSVPEQYVNQELRYSIIKDKVIFFDNNKEVARHKKVDGKHSYSVEIRHYINTLRKKPGALDRSLALKQSDERLIRIYQEKYNGKPKEFIEFLFEESNIKQKEEGNISIETASYNQLKDINSVYAL